MKKIILFFIILALGIGAYALLKKENSFSFSFLQDRAGSFREDAKEFFTTDSSVNSLKEQAQDVVADIEEKGEETIDDISYSARETVYEKIKEAVLDPLQQSAKNLFGFSDEEATRIERSVASVVQFDNVDEFVVGYVVKKGEQIYFNIKNPFFAQTGTTPFTVSWEDGVMESGELGEGEGARVISHIWQKEGEYLIVVLFSHSGADSIEQKVRVVVIE